LATIDAMTTDIARGSPNAPLDRAATSGVVRWLLGLCLVVLLIVILAVVAAAIFAARMWVEDRAAAKAVESEIVRLQAAGEPVTVSDLYGAHELPTDTPNTAEAWLAAIKLATGSMQRDTKGIPDVGDGTPALLRSDAVGSQLAASEEFLAKYNSVLQATLAAAAQPGECRFPRKFELGVSGVLSDVQNVRALVRLLSLKVHVEAKRGNADAALESLLALFAVSDTLSHEQMLVEQEIRLVTLAAAQSEAELLVNQAQLTAEHLARLQQRIEECDIQGSFTCSLTGERALGYQAFQQFGGFGYSSDLQRYLEIMASLIQFSGQPPATGRQNAQSLLADYQAQQKSASPWQKNKYARTTLLVPMLAKLLDIRNTVIAQRDALITAIAAERCRLATGDFPTQLTDLTPDYLPATPLDPFDAQPLRLLRKGDELLIYSIGTNHQDDGASNPPGNSREPDIVVRIIAVKASSL
jgi:hypothetical protein